MSKIAVANTDLETQKSSTSNQYEGKIYGLVKSIREDLEVYDLEPGQVSIDVDVESSEDSLDVEYQVETLGWYEDDGELGLGKDPVSFNNSYSIDTSTSLVEQEVTHILENDFSDAAIRANGEVIRESLSPDYDAFS